jgi:threonyl-tRNA synthetase
LLKGIYKDLGFDSFKVRFSDRPEKRAGTDELWDKAEEALKAATQAAGIEYSLNPGEGAFYGPKLEFVLKDCIGREWQCGTLQVDYSIPERLDATYVGEDGQKHRPVMLHRAVLGSMERFIGVLIEHYAGKFPVWLAPVQVVVASVTTEANDYAINICEQLKAKGIRAELDIRNEKIPYKVREHSLQKIPYIYVVGKREADEKTVAIRKLGGEQQNVMAFDQAMQELYAEANAVVC